DKWVRRLLALPVLPAGSTDSRIQVVHRDDALRFFVRAIENSENDCGPVNLAAPGTLTLAQIAAAIGRRTVRMGSGPAELRVIGSAPLMETSRLGEGGGLRRPWGG